MPVEPPSDETVRVLRKPSPPHLERLLAGLVAGADLVPQGSHQVRDPASMPKALRMLAKLAAMNGHAWSCWTDEILTWLVTAEMLSQLSRERGAPVLQVDVYDEDGPKDSGLWTIDRHGKWRRCTD